MIIWTDVESTGLDEQTGLLLEVAMVATTDFLDPLDDGISVVIGHDRESVRAMMTTEVLTMHERSGLLDDVAESGHTVATATAALLGYLERFDERDLGRAPLAGSNIKFDRAWLGRFMPAMNESVHYRDICVSTVKELARRFWPEVYATAPAKQHLHRALDDIGESVDELRYYLERIGAPSLQTVL